MISARAQDSLGQMLRHAIKASLLASPQDTIAIEPVADVSRFSSTQIVMLSVSSYFFRLMVMVHFTPDDLTKAHFAAIHRMEPSAMDAQAFSDAISECGNICCGTLNRDLAQKFAHVGMSTPNIIDKRCAYYLGALGSSHQQHFDIAIPNGPSFHASLCISAFEELDFVIAPQEAQSSGELEMF